MKHASCHLCTPPFPPSPLILGGWVYSNDVAKMDRWGETVAWASANGCAEIVNEIAHSDFYFVESLSTHTVGPLYAPMYRPWDYETKTRPSTEDLDRHFETLVSTWSEIVGEELSVATRPKAFTGRKARRLLVYASAHIRPPWGTWLQLSEEVSKRRAFTKFRASISSAIAPHEIDHVDFWIDIEHT